MKSRRITSNIEKEKAAEEFGRKAELLLPSTNTTNDNHKYRRYTFSLTEEVSQQIDDLSLTTARINRSDIVKAGILALRSLPSEELKRLLIKAKTSKS